MNTKILKALILFYELKHMAFKQYIQICVTTYPYIITFSHALSIRHWSLLIQIVQFNYLSLKHVFERLRMWNIESSIIIKMQKWTRWSYYVHMKLCSNQHANIWKFDIVIHNIIISVLPKHIESISMTNALMTFPEKEFQITLMDGLGTGISV